MSMVQKLKCVWGCAIPSEDQAGLDGEQVKLPRRKGVWGSPRASSGCQSTWMSLGARAQAYGTRVVLASCAPVSETVCTSN